ncbi:MAG: Na(+)-translocating NADH-quinone reductase subunit E [Gammaproteobacteria bacterium]|nr:MAG: Na(+)-translocating NADH-quinone reductase subunit E [Gammaproteobacteria bacterium]
MGTFIVVFLMFVAMIVLMAVGVMMKRKPISGSCGGLGHIGIEKACDCDKPCDKRLATMPGEQPVSLTKK